MPDKADVIQGTLDLLILQTLSVAPQHGFGVTRRIEQVSNGVFRVNPGSLLLAFRRLEREGLVTARWEVTEHNRRARIYRLTAAGKRKLEQDTHAWERRSAAMQRLLGNET